jgi:hypothetical protein
MPPQIAPGIEREVLRLNRTRRFAPSQISETTGVSKNTVHRVLHRNGVKAFRAKPPVYTEEVEREVIRRYVFEGEAAEKIGRELYMHPQTALKIVREHGYTVRPRGGMRFSIPAKEIDFYGRLYKDEDLLIAEIEEMTGLDHRAVIRRLDRAGVEP